MRIAIITDVHENFAALSRAIGFLKKSGYELLICLGDIAGFAANYYQHHPDANACIELLREEADIVLSGNHDHFTCRRLSSYQLEKGLPLNWYDLHPAEQKSISGNNFWLYESEIVPELSSGNMKFLLNLQEWHIIEVNDVKLLFSHFVKPDLVGTGTWMPQRISQLQPHFRFMEENDCRLSFTGHFHPDGITIADRYFHTITGASTFKLKRKPSIVLCPALSGKNSSSCIIFDSANNEIIPYILG
jgi:predicted phosphodiesterase